MKRGVWLVVFCLTGMWLYAQPGEQALREFLATTGLKRAAVSISVKRVADGRTLLAHSPEMALTPASVMKVLPTWMVLQKKGGSYRFQTLVYHTGTISDGVLNGDIVVVAGGDPCPDSRFFSEYSLKVKLANAIEEAGIRHIRGDVVVEGAKKATEIPGSWTWEDVSNYYGALYLPFNYRDNMFTLKLRSGKPGTLTELISAVPEQSDIRVVNEVRAAADNKDDAWIYGGPYSKIWCVKGTIPSHRAEFSVKGAMPDPAVIFVREVSDEWKRRGIKVDGGKGFGKEKQLLFRFDSPPLSEIVYHTNKRSVNLFAEALGAEATDGKWLEQVKSLLWQSGVDTVGVSIADACGLSRLNALPAVLFTDLLVHIGRNPNKELFVRSLPVGGVDAGLNGYCQDAPELKNKLQAKTGSMSGVRSLTGFLTAKNGEQLAFCVLVNNYSCSSRQLQQAVGKLLANVLMC